MRKRKESAPENLMSGTGTEVVKSVLNAQLRQTTSFGFVTDGLTPITSY